MYVYHFDRRKKNKGLMKVCRKEGREIIDMRHLVCVGRSVVKVEVSGDGRSRLGVGH